VQFLPGARVRIQQALGPAPRAPYASQHVDSGDSSAQPKVAPAWAAGRHLDRRPIRRTGQTTGEPLYGPLSRAGKFAIAGRAPQGRLLGEDIEFADLSEQVGDPPERFPEPGCLFPGKKRLE